MNLTFSDLRSHSRPKHRTHTPPDSSLSPRSAYGRDFLSGVSADSSHTIRADRATAAPPHEGCWRPIAAGRSYRKQTIVIVCGWLTIARFATGRIGFAYAGRPPQPTCKARMPSTTHDASKLLGS